MKLTIYAAMALSALMMPMTGLRAPVIHWAAYYSSEPSSYLNRFELLVLDSDNHPPLAPLVDSGKTLLGYISIGEVESKKAHFAHAKASGILAGENEDWKGSYFVDVRDRRWSDQVMKLVGDDVKNGFQGVFLDTVDDAHLLQTRDPKKYAGMQDAMAQLIMEVRRQYPSILIAVGRSYSILPAIDKTVDMVIGESIYADFNTTTRTYTKVPTEVYDQRVATLTAAVRRNPRLRILTLDYWNPSDTAGIAQIYRSQRENGFSPYVSSLNMNQIVLEPRQ